jgi:hypothetical protein
MKTSAVIAATPNRMSSMSSSRGWPQVPDTDGQLKNVSGARPGTAHWGRFYALSNHGISQELCNVMPSGLPGQSQLWPVVAGRPQLSQSAGGDRRKIAGSGPGSAAPYWAQMSPALLCDAAQYGDDTCSGQGSDALS